MFISMQMLGRIFLPLTLLTRAVLAFIRPQQSSLLHVHMKFKVTRFINSRLQIKQIQSERRNLEHFDEYLAAIIGTVSDLRNEKLGSWE